ncbi:hypothetical protein CH273_13520 [Rhodococcus sp. 05-339-2]|nr:hypothetical protein CH273_13520 [Rhodococcus sp. 05-339-2]
MVEEVRMVQVEDSTTVYYVELVCGVRHEGDLGDVVDPLMDAFEELSGVNDVDVATDNERSELTVFLYVPAKSQPEALEIAQAATRTAVHATGGWTPDWDESEGIDPEPRSTVQRADLVTS